MLEILDLDDLPDQPEPDARVELGSVLVTGDDAQTAVVELDSLCAIAASVLTGEGLTSVRVDLHLVDTDTMAELNAEHMRAEGPTDVLAFPLEPPGDEPGELEVGGAASAAVESEDTDAAHVHLGDVVICPAVAIGQAAGHTGSIDAELALLTIHGVLHLLGHDHAETDERLIMQARERIHLSPLGVDHPVPDPQATPSRVTDPVMASVEARETGKDS